MRPARNGDAERAATRAMRAKFVFERKQDGATFQEIAAELGVAVGTVHGDYTRHLATIPVQAVEDYRAQQRQRLQQMREIVADVVAKRHLTVSDGRIVRGEDDNALEDDGPVLAAIDRLIKIDEREAKLMGLDSRPELRVEGNLTYEIVGIAPDEILGLPSGSDDS